MLYRGSIPLYDYSLGVRGHPPLYIAGEKMKCFVLTSNKRSRFGI